MVSYTLMLLSVKLIIVLILVVVDNGLVPSGDRFATSIVSSLNPCCSGQWSRTIYLLIFKIRRTYVLILVVVDNGLVHIAVSASQLTRRSLNPCCSGQWSRTDKKNIGSKGTKKS